MAKISESIEKGKCIVRALKNDRKRSGRHQNTYLYDLTRRKGFNFLKSQKRVPTVGITDTIVYPPPFGFYPNRFELVQNVPIGVYPCSLYLEKSF